MSSIAQRHPAVVCASLLILAGLAIVPAAAAVPASPATYSDRIPGLLPGRSGETCTEMLVNGSFEEPGGWTIPSTPYPAARTTEKHYDGAYSMRTGITATGDNTGSYSDFSQVVELPATGDYVLEFWRWPQTGPSASGVASEPRANLAEIAGMNSLDEFHRALDGSLGIAAGDLQYGMIIDPPDGATFTFLFYGLDNNRTWINRQFDVSSFRGHRIRIQFGTYNDGIGSIAAQYLDAVSLKRCAGGPSTETPTNTPTVAVTRSATPTRTPTATLTPTHTPAPTNTATATASATNTPSSTATASVTPTPSPTKTSTTPPTSTGTATPTATTGPVSSTWLPMVIHQYPVLEATPTATPTSEPGSSPTPTVTPTATSTRKPNEFTFGDLYPSALLAQPTLIESLWVLDTDGRLLRSTDGGATWGTLDLASRLGSMPTTFGGSYSSPFTLWVGTAAGPFYSDDLGEHWTEAGTQQLAGGITVDFDNPSILWSGGAIQGPITVLRSTDHAGSWGRADTGLTSAGMAASVLIDPDYRNTLYAYTWSQGGEARLWRGQTPGLWSGIAGPLDGIQPPLIPLLGLSWRGDEGSLWAGGPDGALLYSANPRELVGSQVKWSQASTFGPGYFVQPLAWASGPSIYITLHRLDPPGGALLRSSDRGQTWVQLDLPN